MKSLKTYTSLASIAFIALLLCTTSVQAQETQDPTENRIEVQNQLRASTTAPRGPLKNPRPPVKSQAEIKLEKNMEIRNAELMKQQEMRREVKEIKAETKTDLKTLRASSTDMFKRMKDDRKEIKKKMEIRSFEIRLAALVKELKVSLTNLDGISTRIDARITKLEGEGKDLTEAKAEFVIAKDKLAKAKIAVATLEAFKIGSTTPATNASTTVEVELSKPRVIGDAAIKSVKEARDALKKVIQAIAHSQGNKNGMKINATTTATTTVGTN